MDKRHDSAILAAHNFIERDSVFEIEDLGEGNINDTYLVRCGDRSFVLQRINGLVFPRPEWVVENFRVVTSHLAKRPPEACPQWRDIQLHPTASGRSFFQDAEGSIWRAQSYLDGMETFSAISSFEQAVQIGLALGRFHRFLADLPSSALHDTLPGFHVLATYLAHFDRVKDCRLVPDSPGLRYGLETVARYRSRMDGLRQAEKKGLLVSRIIHGDPKTDNILFDRKTGKAVCLIDLDTVRPGLLLYDIGDCLRSCCNPAGEKGENPEAVSFRIDLAREILNGYYSGVGQFVTARDKEYIHAAVCLLCFELGLRFLTDYINGNRYFRTQKPDENLHRGLRQFYLLETVMDMGDVFRSF